MPRPPGADYKRDFWADGNTKCTRLRHRTLKIGASVNCLAGGMNWRLLDVGCGSATLGLLLDPNVQYFGIDIATQEPSPNLTECDIPQEPITLEETRFDLIVAQGLFEYLADRQSRKSTEIVDLLGPQGKFIASYVNFDHRRPNHCWPYSSIQPAAQFRASLGEHFIVERQFPTRPRFTFSGQSRKHLAPLPIIEQYKDVRCPF